MTNGDERVEARLREGQLVIRDEADGYLPALTNSSESSEASLHRSASRGRKSNEARLLAFDEPDHVEDVNGFVEAKINALLCHQSQFQSTMGTDDDPELEAFRRRVEDKLATSGRAGGVELAEVFKLIDDL